MTEYLTPKDLAERYGIKISTVRVWRQRTKRGQSYGPKWEDTGPVLLKPYSPRIRYKLTDVLEWEAKNNIQPQTSN